MSFLVTVSLYLEKLLMVIVFSIYLVSNLDILVESLLNRGVIRVHKLTLSSKNKTQHCFKLKRL